MKLIIINRLAPRSSLYFDICQKSYEDFQKAKVKHDRLKNDELGITWSALQITNQQMLEHSTTATIFAALCLEAFIYDFAAMAFSDTFVQKYLDKLDFVSKWVVIPKLVLGKDFPRDSQAFEYLVKLRTARHKLIHAKSRAIPTAQEKLVEVVDELEKEEEKDIEIAYHAVIKVLTELRKLDDTGETFKWWSFIEHP